MAAERLHGDDTTVPVLAKGKYRHDLGFIGVGNKRVMAFTDFRIESLGELYGNVQRRSLAAQPSRWRKLVALRPTPNAHPSPILNP